jgi:hypothetical protein
MDRARRDRPHRRAYDAATHSRRRPVDTPDSNNDFESRFLHHFLGASTDFSLVVLKGHLLLEEIVNRWLAALVHKPEAIKGANFRFSQKLCLIRALMPAGVGEIELDAAEKLNTMRNRLAHHLDYREIEARVKDFLSLYEPDPDDPKREAVPLITRLRNWIPFFLFECEEITNWP